MYLYSFYQQLIKKKQSEVVPFNQSDSWPMQWKTVTNKVYERFPLLSLPPVYDKSDLAKRLLAETILGRHSGRAFGRVVTEEKLSALLYYSLGEVPSEINATPRRMYPSAGGRYPLEGYLLLFRPVGKIAAGVYHYDVANHGLRRLREETFDSTKLTTATAEAYLEKSVGALILSAVWARSAIKYGERSYKFVLLEAGAVMQNAGLLAAALDLEAVQVGTFAEDVIEPLLDIDGHQESYLHALFFG